MNNFPNESVSHQIAGSANKPENGKHMEDDEFENENFEQSTKCEGLEFYEQESMGDGFEAFYYNNEVF
mgnify:CR=1 FL=1